MKNSSDLLYNILPLILIIAFSWLFGVLGSKKKKMPQEPMKSPVPAGEKEPDFMDLLRLPSDNSRADEPIPPPIATPEKGQQSGKWAPGAGAPIITPDPIKPKWWGA